MALPSSSTNWSRNIQDISDSLWQMKKTKPNTIINFTAMAHTRKNYHKFSLDNGVSKIWKKTNNKQPVN